MTKVQLAHELLQLNTTLNYEKLKIIILTNEHII